jgi:hypothetical protein
MWTDPWPSLTIVQLEQALTDIASLVQNPHRDQPDEVTRALSRFLLIRTCGYLEQVVEQCCIAYLTSKASPRVSRFGSSWLGRGANPSPDRLVELVRRFDGEWADELKAEFEADDQLLQREISFLVDRRNRIAHGLGEGVGARKALDLGTYTAAVADWFIRRFDPR